MYQWNELANPLTGTLVNRDLPGANPYDADAMEAQREHLKKVLDIAIDRPDDFYFAVVVVGRDAGIPYIHGTLGSPLLFAAAGEGMTPRDKALTVEVMKTYGKENIYRALATDGKGEFAPLPLAGAGELTAPLPDAPDVEEGLGDEFLQQLARIIGGMVEEVSPGVFAISIGDAVHTDKVDDDGRHADDGCPHAGGTDTPTD